MDENRLAHEVVNRLAPFLDRLLDGRDRSSNVDPQEEQAAALWQALYPKIALRTGVMIAARNFSEMDSTENREALSMELALVFRTNPFLATEIQEYLTTLGSDFPPTEQQVSGRPRAPLSKPGASAQEFGPDQIVCQVCGGQDETLRLVSYPFVFSLVVVTFRRMFQGVYCSRHANRYFFLAVVITLSVGWLGIPFGLIFTPIALFNLFTSDKRLRRANAKMLLEIAKAKQEKGSVKDASALLREALWLDDQLSLEQESQLTLTKHIAPRLPLPVSQVLWLVSGFAAAWIIGFFIGLVDGLFSSSFTNLEGQISVLVILFSYFPLLLMLYFGGFVLANLVRWMLERTQITHSLAGRLVAGITALTAFYAILTGNWYYSMRVGSGLASVSLIDAIRTNGSLLVHGGWLTMAGLIRQGTIADLLFMVMVIFGLMAFVWLGQDWANQTIRWRSALQEIQHSQTVDAGVWVGVSAILVIGLVFLVLSLLFLP